LLQQLNRSDDGSNLVASLASLAIALAMLETGAGEQVLGPARRSRFITLPDRVLLYQFAVPIWKPT
jgi:hypothetical protein